MSNAERYLVLGIVNNSPAHVSLTRLQSCTGIDGEFRSNAKTVLHEECQVFRLQMHITTPALIHERTVDMGLIVALLGYLGGTAGAGTAGLGGDMYGAFMNFYVWYSNFMCQWGC